MPAAWRNISRSTKAWGNGSAGTASTWQRGLKAAVELRGLSRAIIDVTNHQLARPAEARRQARRGEFTGRNELLLALLEILRATGWEVQETPEGAAFLKFAVRLLARYLGSLLVAPAIRWLGGQAPPRRVHESTPRMLRGPNLAGRPHVIGGLREYARRACVLSPSSGVRFARPQPSLAY